MQNKKIEYKTSEDNCNWFVSVWVNGQYAGCAVKASKKECRDYALAFAK